MFSSIDFWRLNDILSVQQAAMLSVGVNPGEVDLIHGEDGYFQKKNTSNNINNYFTSPEYVAVACAIRGAVSSGKINQNHEEDIYVDELKKWMEEKNFFPPFFFPDGVTAEGFRDKRHPRYSAKLACAVSAWEAVHTPARNKSPKQTIEAWVAENGMQFGLSHEDGVISKTAIEEIAKVVNWDTKGGANRTGGEAIDLAIVSKSNSIGNSKPISNFSDQRNAFVCDEDDSDIPF